MRWNTVARETGTPYDAGSVAVRDGAKVPELAELLDILEADSKLIARAIALIARLHETGDVEAATGLPLELWLSQLGRATGADRRMLLTSADVLPSMPGTFAAFRAGQLSWGQIRSIVMSAKPLNRDYRAELDGIIVEELPHDRDEEPHRLPLRVEDLADRLWREQVDATEAEDLSEPVEEYLYMQPRLDRRGGKMWAQYGELNFAELEGRIAEERERPELEAVPVLDGANPDATARNREALGAANAQALMSLLRQSDGEGSKRQPLVLATTTVDDLLGLTRGHGELLTTLTGGRLRVDSATLRRLVDEGGAALRMIVTEDTGAVVGVGTRKRVPPGWLRDASLAAHAECVEPLCTRSARTCDLDHAIPWEPAPGQDARGPTDVRNTAPLCRSVHTRKDRNGWTLSPADADGVRTWHHAPTGMTIKVRPDTYRHRRQKPPRS